MTISRMDLNAGTKKKLQKNRILGHDLEPYKIEQRNSQLILKLNSEERRTGNNHLSNKLNKTHMIETNIISSFNPTEVKIQLTFLSNAQSDQIRLHFVLKEFHP